MIDKIPTELLKKETSILNKVVLKFGDKNSLQIKNFQKLCEISVKALKKNKKIIFYFLTGIYEKCIKSSIFHSSYLPLPRRLLIIKGGSFLMSYSLRAMS